MKKYDTILFDLDGTLTDPGVGITNAVAYALHQYGIIIEDKTILYPFIGPPLLDSFQKYYGFSDEKANRAITYYREYYSKTGIFENVVYDGIKELLQNLKEHNKSLIVATSKPELFARQILDHFGLSEYFRFIAGATMDGSLSRKGDIIKYALNRCNITSVSSAIMIGDREHDVIGAKKAGIDCIGVLFGYGTRTELEAAGASYIAESVSDILTYVI